MRLANVLLLSGVFSAFGPARAQDSSIAGERVNSYKGNNISPPRFSSQAARDRAERAEFYRKGVKLATGENGAQGMAGAAAWFLKAAELGHPEAMQALAELYQSGRGVAPDPAAALGWYRRAAEAGLAGAQYNLAVMLAGSGDPRDTAEAALWYERAARRGFAKAQFNLGLLLAAPGQAQPDVEQAYKWLKIADDAGIDIAKSQLALLAPRMTAQQLAHADQLAREWRPANEN